MSEWNVNTLKEHLTEVIALNDKRYEERFVAAQQALHLGFSAQKSAVDAALAAADRAVLKAEVATEKRLEGVNEFRQTLSDQQKTLASRNETEAAKEALTEKIDRLQAQMDKLISERQGIRGGWGYAVGLIGFVLTLVTLVMVFLKFGK